MQNILNDSIVRINNGQKYRFSVIKLNLSEILLSFLKVLYSEGFIRGFKKSNKSILVFLKYNSGDFAICSIKSVSTANKRIYVSYKDILQLLNRKELLIILTPKGFISSKNLFNDNLLGGEVICKIF